jgi:hypothetical protein
MYLCMYACVCACLVHVCMYVNLLCTYVYTYIWISLSCLWFCIRMYVCRDVYMLDFINMYVVCFWVFGSPEWACTVFVCIHVCMHVLLIVCMCACMYVCVCYVTYHVVCMHVGCVQSVNMCVVCFWVSSSHERTYTVCMQVYMYVCKLCVCRCDFGLLVLSMNLCMHVYYTYVHTCVLHTYNCFMHVRMAPNGPFNAYVCEWCITLNTAVSHTCMLRCHVYGLWIYVCFYHVCMATFLYANRW